MTNFIEFSMLDLTVKTLHKCQVSGLEITTRKEEDQIGIYYQVERTGHRDTRKIFVSTEDWEIIRERIEIRMGCSDLNTASIVAHVLFNTFPGLITTLS
ncbi:Hypothetical protein POVR1_LOCUS67 [uncultured virus]|nr:Hypothetical protein POVR1_LOCUS67 [uncultured virus]